MLMLASFPALKTLFHAWKKTPIFSFDFSFFFCERTSFPFLLWSFLPAVAFLCVCGFGVCAEQQSCRQRKEKIRRGGTNEKCSPHPHAVLLIANSDFFLLLVDWCWHPNFCFTQVSAPQTEAASADNTSSDTKEPAKVVLTFSVTLPAFRSWISLSSCLHLF